MLWDGNAFDATFSPDGRYSCCNWSGSWHLHWPTLYFRERPCEESEYREYAVRLDSRWKGVFIYGREGSFELRPRR